MTTTYKEPRIEIEQQFAATASNTYLPELRGCIVAPFYDIVEEESAGTYVNVEEEYNWASTRPVDVRTGDNDDEVTYPLTINLKNALTEILSNKLGATTGTPDAYTFVASDQTLTYPLPADTEMFIKFDSGVYTHSFDGCTLAADGYILRFTVGAGTIPALPATITDTISGATLALVAVYDSDGVEATGAMPVTGFIRGTTLAISNFGAGNACNIDGVGCTFVNTAAEEDHYTLTTTSPTFYQDLDFFGTITSTTTLTLGAVQKAGTITNFVSSTVMWLRSSDMHAPGVLDSGYITRASLSTAETTLRQVRSVSSATTCRLASAKTGVAYTSVTYDLFEQRDYDITIDDFTDWGIVLDTDGVILPTAMVTPTTLYPVTTADVYLTYRALRTDLEDELEYYETIAEATTEFTTINKYNTGAYMLYLALLNSNGRPIYVTGLGEDYYTSVTTAYTNALSFLEDKRLYAIACASMKPAVHTLVKAHIDLCSTAEQGAWRIGINCHELADHSVIVTEQTSGAGYVDIYREGFTGNKIVDAAATWVADGVTAGDSVYVKSWTGITPGLLDTYAVGGAQTVDQTDWGTSDTTIVITTVPEPSASLRGKTIVIEGFNDGEMGTDTGIYTDHTRSESISTGQDYTALGYKIISSYWASNILTLHICTTDSSLTPAASTAVTSVMIYDGPLSLSEENAILEDYTEIGTVTADDIMAVTFKSGYTGVYTGVTYEIRKEYDRDDMAENYAAYTSSFDERRMNFVFPHVYQHSDGSQLHGYFIAAAEAGWIGGAYPHQSITSQNLQGFYRLLYSNKYFKKSQLNEIAGGGVTIYTQEVDDAGITCRHQLTSDMESILTQENSITRAVDTGSYMVLDALNPLKGRYNIVDDLYSVINTKVNAIRKLLCEKKYSRYGSILRKFEVTSLIQDTTAQDGLYLEIECETQKPFNRARVLIKVS